MERPKCIKLTEEEALKRMEAFDARKEQFTAAVRKVKNGDRIMPVRQPRYSPEEAARRGDEIYKRDARPIVENEQSKGKSVLTDIESGAWQMDADEMSAARRLEALLPDPQVWMVRVGYPSLRRFGAGRERHSALYRGLSSQSAKPSFARADCDIL